MGVGHIGIVFLIRRTKLKFQNVFRRISRVSNGGIVCVGGVDTDVVIGRILIHRLLRWSWLWRQPKAA